MIPSNSRLHTPPNKGNRKNIKVSHFHPEARDHAGPDQLSITLEGIGRRSGSGFIRKGI
jgi:hypothetical protein